MSAIPVSRPPNPEIVGKLQYISDQSMNGFDQLKKDFKILPKEESHKTEPQWNLAHVAGALVLGALAAFVYKKAHPYIAIGLGITAALPLYQSRVQVDVPTPAEIELRKRINTCFLGVASELRTNWEVASKVFAKINMDNFNSAEEADRETTDHEVVYRRGAGIDDPFNTLSADEKEWRNSFQDLHPIAYDFIRNKTMENLTNDSDLHPVVKEQLLQVYVECMRLVHGSVPLVLGKPYVENKMVGEKLVSQPWPAPPLKV